MEFSTDFREGSGFASSYQEAADQLLALAYKRYLDLPINDSCKDPPKADRSCKDPIELIAPELASLSKLHGGVWIGRLKITMIGLIQNMPKG